MLRKCTEALPLGFLLIAMENLNCQKQGKTNFFQTIQKLFSKQLWNFSRSFYQSCYNVGQIKQSRNLFSSCTLRKKYPYWELFWSVCSQIRCISPYSVQMRENTDQNNPEYGHFSRSGTFSYSAFSVKFHTCPALTNWYSSSCQMAFRHYGGNSFKDTHREKAP